MSTLAAYSLWQREMVRFWRQPSRVLSAVGTPLLFWLFMGTGLSSSFRLPGAPLDLSYLEYFFPGTLVLLVLFASIYSTISVIEDRHAGFLQAVLVAPVHRAALVAGKVAGGGTLAWLQGAVFLLLAPLAGIPFAPLRAAAAAAVLALLALGLTATGFAFAWRVDSTQGFHGVMNLILFPMWFLSGAVFPMAGAPGWLEWLMRLNPLTYGVAALRRVLYEDPRGLGEALPALGSSLGVISVGAGIAIAADLLLVRRAGIGSTR